LGLVGALQSLPARTEYHPRPVLSTPGGQITDRDRSPGIARIGDPAFRPPPIARIARIQEDPPEVKEDPQDPGGAMPGPRSPRQTTRPDRGGDPRPWRVQDRPRSFGRGAGQPGQRKHHTAPHRTGRAGRRGAGQPGAGHTPHRPAQKPRPPESAPPTPYLARMTADQVPPPPAKSTKLRFCGAYIYPGQQNLQFCWAGARAGPGADRAGLLRIQAG
jgi:hypothetical protein